MREKERERERERADTKSKRNKHGAIFRQREIWRQNERVIERKQEKDRG